MNLAGGYRVDFYYAAIDALEVTNHSAHIGAAPVVLQNGDPELAMEIVDDFSDPTRFLSSRGI